MPGQAAALRVRNSLARHGVSGEALERECAFARIAAEEACPIDADRLAARVLNDRPGAADGLRGHRPAGPFAHIFRPHFDPRQAIVALHTIWSGIGPETLAVATFSQERTPV